MPLSPTGPDLSFLDNLPSENEEIASVWATALGDYASGIVSAPLVPGTAEAATAALEGLLIGTLPLGLAAGATGVFDAPMIAFGGLIAVGMAPLFIGIPPVVPFSAMVLPPGVLYPDAESAKSAIGALIYAWFATGTATPSVGGPPIPWS
tara:strand:+ start:608 stop:1057 length:450 start_codon:yes stop_codon:yes gene_type:complete